MKKSTKKVNIKQVAKNEVKAQITNIFAEKYEVIDCAETLVNGFTKDTIIVRGYVSGNNEPVDIQVKLIAPKFGINQYDLEEEDD